jgi:chromosome segregation ATPase
LWLKRLAISVLLFSLFFAACSGSIHGAEAGYIISEQQRMEFLQIIKELRISLAERSRQYESLKVNNKLTTEQLQSLERINSNLQQRISGLEISINNKETSYNQLQAETDSIRSGLTSLKKEFESCRRQNKMLKAAAIIEGIIIAGLLL